ncbi:polyubiquitin [Colletotrichum orchidophilum]|uniref:Polyubiquitin n=1 Tax=Colletotrichum orchidophilum TaxID=1209926 RepID=A0A1G4B6E1_9PEZI|nr:polyubiquitin [Colletotrichum orchidophilum]OHE96883.1 polyubiquitin [Colletotrichum orchidophilum]
MEAQYITITFGTRRRLIARPDSYGNLIEKARATFDIKAADLVVLCSSKPMKEEVEIDESAYGAVASGWILRLEATSDRLIEPDDEPEQRRSTAQPTSPVIEFTVKTLNGLIMRLNMSPADTVFDLKMLILDKEDIMPELQRLIYNGRRLKDERTLSYYSITNNSSLSLIPRQRGGKPAIYLMSPTELKDVDVKVDLSHHWTFMTIYPLVEGAVGQNSVFWQVSAGPDGTLEDNATGTECSYLFWEADALADPSSDVPEAFCFNPQNPLAYFIDNYVLPFAVFVPYLDRVLASLTLTPAMRTEMVVYWLPKFQKIRDRGLQIAFNFIPQADFEKADFYSRFWRGGLQILIDNDRVFSMTRIVKNKTLAFPTSWKQTHFPWEASIFDSPYQS